MDKWLTFYSPHFESQDEARRFVEACEKQTPPDNTAKILMHQTQRLVSLSVDMPKIRPNDESLQLLFLVMCAENVAKLNDGYTGESKSRFYVRKFFKDFLSDADKSSLESSFIDNDDEWLRPLSLERVVDMFYRIRCDVVHEGNYIDFAFSNGNMALLNTDPNVIAHLSLKDVREIVIRSCISAIKSRL